MASWSSRLTELLGELDVASRSPESARDWELRLRRAMPSFPPPLTVLEGSVRAQQPHAPDLLRALGLDAPVDLPSTATHARRIYLGDDLVALTTVSQHAPARELTIWAADTAVLERVLSAASTTKMRPLLDTTELPMSGTPPAFGTAQHTYAGDFGALEIAIDRSTLSQRLSLLGATVELARFEPDSSSCRYLALASGSPRVERWALRTRVVQSARRYEEPQIADYLSERGLGGHLAAASRLERALGGLIAPASHDPIARRPSMALGLALVAAGPAALSAAWLESAEDWDEDDPDLVAGARPLGRGVWHWGATKLLLVGEHAERFLFCDEEGRIWLWDSVTQETSVAAERSDVFLERLAIDDHLWHALRPCALSPLQIFGTVGDAVATALALAPLPEATDGMVQHWASGDAWLRQVTEHGANVAETRLYTTSSASALEGARAARIARPSVPIRVWSNEPTGLAHRTALVDGGIDDLPTLLDRGGVPRRSPS